MRSKYILIMTSVLVAIVAVAVVVSAGNPDTPPGVPEETYSYTLEHIYQRLSTGAAGTPITFTEPSEGPLTGTMHTLNDIMFVAPEVDNINGATQTHLLANMTAWGLTSGEWGPITGTMPNNGAGSTIVPTTTNQNLAAGYWSSVNTVEGDIDLVAGNIVLGINLFGVDGTLIATNIPKTGQTTANTTGDDGDLEMGIAWPEPRFITGTTGVVTDTLTGLIWLENANCAQATEDWSDALLSYISNLNAFGMMNGYSCSDTSNGGGHQTDWRLPNVRELHSLVHYGAYSPALPNTAGTGQWSEGDPFINVESDRYWTSSNRAGDPTLWAWCLNMVDGQVIIDLKANTYYVWPVRGGP